MATQSTQKFQTKKATLQTVNPDFTGLTPSLADKNRTDQLAGLVGQTPGESLTTNAGLIISDN